MPNNEFTRFKKWLRDNGFTEQAFNLKQSTYKRNPLYNTWQEQLATPTTVPGQEPELTPEEYLSFIRKIWWEDPEFDNATIPEQAELLKAQIEAEGFSIYSPGYNLALAYKNSFKERGLEIITNYEDKGYDVAKDEQGNISIIGGTALDETEMSAWQKGQYEIDLKRFGLAEEQFAFQQQQAVQQTQYQRAQLAVQQSQARQAEMQAAAQLAGLGEEGWIQQWYARQAQQAQFTAAQKPWWAERVGMAGMVGWGEMKPNERADWIRRFEKGQWARLSPDVQKSVLQGFGFPTPTVGGQISFGEDIPAEKQVAPAGAVDWTRFGARGEGGVLTTKTIPSLGIEAPFRVGEVPPREERRARPTPRPTTPPTPEWLPQFAPWLTTGQPITRGQMPTPSGQQWAGIPPSVIGGLKGFTKWGGAGRSLEDIYAHMRQMQPQAPIGGRGRWQPARQWA